MAARGTGTARWFNEIRGEDRISRGAGNRDVSVHYSDIEGEGPLVLRHLSCTTSAGPRESGFRTLRKGQRVEFTIEPDIQRPKATQVRILDPS